MKINNNYAFNAVLVVVALIMLSACAPTLLTHDVIESGDMSDLKNYLSDGVTVNTRNIDGESLLHVAARNGNIKKVRFLVENGADVNARTFEGNTPFTLAVLDKRESLIKYFQSLNVNLKSNYKNSNAVFDAVLAGNTDVLIYLLDNGLDIHASNVDNENALHMAAGVGNIEIVKFLISKEINASQQTIANKMQPIHYAALSKKYDVIDVFLNSKIKPAVVDSDLDSKIATAILYEYIASKVNNNSKSKVMYQIASNHYASASQSYDAVVNDIEGEITAGTLRNVGAILFAVAAAKAAPAQTTMNSSGQMVSMQPAYYTGWNGSGTLEEQAEQYTKLSADMLLASKNCQRKSEQL